MNKKYCVLFLVIAILVSSLTGCDEFYKYSAISRIKMDEEGHTEQLYEFDSPYTICYKNKDDTYSLYIFSSPIQYREGDEYVVINNTVVKSTDKAYKYENMANSIRTYFPKTLDQNFYIYGNGEMIWFKPLVDAKGFSEGKACEYTNMYGDMVSAVMYAGEQIDYVFYPVKSGIKSEIVLKQKPTDNHIRFSMITGTREYLNDHNGYVLYYRSNGDNNENTALVYAPIVKDSADALNISSDIIVDRHVLEDNIDIQLDSELINDDKTVYPVKLDPSFELYLNKIPDTSVYSKFNKNSYLRQYAVVGNHPVLGEGWEYLRFRLNYIVGIHPDKIQSAKYVLHNLNNSSNVHDNDNLQLLAIDEQWTSSQMIWENKVIPSNVIVSEVNNSTKTVTFDISDYAKDCFADSQWQVESMGLVLKSNGNNRCSILASSDNSLYSPFTEIRLYELPAYFESSDSIV